MRRSLGLRAEKVPPVACNIEEVGEGAVGLHVWCRHEPHTGVDQTLEVASKSSTRRKKLTRRVVATRAIQGHVCQQPVLRVQLAVERQPDGAGARPAPLVAAGRWR